jgi:hypothetical protein
MSLIRAHADLIVGTIRGVFRLQAMGELLFAYGTFAYRWLEDVEISQELYHHPPMPQSTYSTAASVCVERGRHAKVAMMAARIDSADARFGR